MADCIRTDCKRERLQAEVERLRGIVQADLEEKAEAWGEVERLKGAVEAYEADAVAYRGKIHQLRTALSALYEREKLDDDHPWLAAARAMARDALGLPPPIEATPSPGPGLGEGVARE